MKDKAFGSRRRTRPGFNLVAAAATFLALATLSGSSGATEPARLPQTADALFNPTNVWTARLKFTAEQWDAMEPAGAEFGFFGGGRPGDRRPFGGPPFGAPGRGGFGGPPDFAPSTLLAPAFMKAGDLNHPGKLSKDEFLALANKWFSAWDKNQSGTLGFEQVRSGLNSVARMPGGGRGGPGPNLLGAEGKRNGLASASGIEFKEVHANLEFAGSPLADVAVRYKGNGTYMESRDSLKRSLKVRLNRFNDGQKVANQSRFNFHNNVTDASWMNEVLSYRLYRDAGVPAGRSSYARVYVTVPGKHDGVYLGLYSMIEEVDKNFIRERLGVKGGGLFKPVTPELFSYLGDDWKEYNQMYDPKGEVGEDEKRRVIAFCKFVTEADDAEFAARLGEFLDLDEFARYMAVTAWLSTMDSILGMGQNFYFYLRQDNHKLIFIPWDLDHSFGQFPMMGSQEQRENLSVKKPWRGENRFLERVYGTGAFHDLYFARLREFSGTIFKPARFHQQVDEIATAIRPAVKDESEDKLARFDKVVAGEAVGRAGGFGRRGGFGGAAKPIKAFVDARARSVEDQLFGKSEGETMDGFGFGGPGGPGGPRGLGPGVLLGPVFMRALDTDKDSRISREEFVAGFAKWFEAWNTDRSGLLTEEQLRLGMDNEFAPFGGRPPGGPGFGPPGAGGPPDEF
jgi:spore coat protein CotH